MVWELIIAFSNAPTHFFTECRFSIGSCADRTIQPGRKITEYVACKLKPGKKNNCIGEKISFSRWRSVCPWRILIITYHFCSTEVIITDSVQSINNSSGASHYQLYNGEQDVQVLRRRTTLLLWIRTVSQLHTWYWAFCSSLTSCSARSCHLQ